MESLTNWISSNGFMPHGHCYLWRPDVLWLNVGSDAAVASAYFAIPVALGYFVKGRRELLRYGLIAMLFAAFIFLCGLTHVISIWTVWHPDYVLEGLVKLLTAAASLATAWMVFRVMPQALTLRTPVELEREVEQRTIELMNLNHQLREQIATAKRTESALRESETRFRLLADTVPALVWQLDVQMRATWFNRQWLEFTGVRPDEEDLDLHARFIHPDDVDRAKGDLLNAYHRRQPFESEIRLRRKDGDYRWMLNRGVPVWEDSGTRFSGFIGCQLDITERKLAQERIEASENQLQLVIDTIPALVSYIDPQYRYRFNNQGYERWFDRTPAQLKGTDIRELLGAEAFAATRPYVDRALQGEVVRFETEMPYKDIGPRPIAVTYTPHVHRNEVLGCVVMIEDTTEQRRIAAQRRASEERAKFLVRLADAIRPLEDPGQIASVAASLLRSHLGADRSAYAEVEVDQDHFQIVGAACADGVAEVSGRYRVASFGDEALRLLRSGAAFIVEDVNAHFPAGASRQAYAQMGIQSLVTIPMLKSGKLVAGIGLHMLRPRQWTNEEIDLLRTVSEDLWETIERARIARALAEANRRKEEFLATLAHELRNPLAPVVNSLAILKARPSADATALKAVEVIERQIRHMTRLVDDLLDVARINSGRIQILPQRSDLRDIATRAIELIQPMLDAAGHGFKMTAPDTPLGVVADPVRMSQVLANLLGNSAKFTPPGGSIELQLEVQDGWTLARVRDTGIGIPADQMTQIFEMFAQADSALDRQHGGLGLGLALARHIVELHGGTIEVSSPGAGGGSEFTVRLKSTDEPVPTSD